MDTRRYRRADGWSSLVARVRRRRAGRDLGLPWAFFGRRAICCRGAALVAGALSLFAAFAFGLFVPGRSGRGAAVSRSAMARHTAGKRLPLAAQGPVSRILGGDDPSYRAARAGNGGLALRNRRQHLYARFDWRGVLIRSGRVALRLSLAGFGYGEVLHAVGVVRPRAQANGVVYRRGAVDEWYANGPLGLEQGFTFRARPARRRAGLLTLSLAASGNVRSSLSRGADAVAFTRPLSRPSRD